MTQYQSRDNDNGETTIFRCCVPPGFMAKTSRFSMLADAFVLICFGMKSLQCGVVHLVCMRMHNVYRLNNYNWKRSISWSSTIAYVYDAIKMHRHPGPALALFYFQKILNSRIRIKLICTKIVYRETFFGRHMAQQLHQLQ